MKRIILGALLCAASAAQANAPVSPETFVIHTSESGHVATVMVPVGAVTNFSADAAEAVPGYDPKVETMRLSGDVRIQVLGERQPIQITADKILLELTADEKPSVKSEVHRTGAATRPRANDSGRDPQTVVGHVTFTVETVAGAMQIEADRVEHRFGSAGA